jgi:hypothetical protein
MSQATLSQIKIPAKMRVNIADLLYEKFCWTDDYHKEHIEQLVELMEEHFGYRPISYYPVYPKKKLRDAFHSFEDEKILSFLCFLTEKDPSLEEPINDIIKPLGIEIHKGDLITTVEREFKIPEEEVTFLSQLAVMGFHEQSQRFEEGLNYLRTGRIEEANSKIQLALDSIFKQILTDLDPNINTSKSLGNLIEEGVRIGLIERDARTVFQGFVSLRNLPPQHADKSGKLNLLTPSLSLLTAHLGRVLAVYLLERYRVLKTSNP